MQQADFDAVSAWIDRHPDLASPVLQVPARQALFSAGDLCQGFPLVLRGEVQVYRESPQGKRLELYRIGAGEICLVSTASLFVGGALTANAVTTQSTELRLLSPAGFLRACDEPELRAFLFGQFAQRLADLMAVTDAVAFQRLDQRLAAALLGHGPLVAASHQDLAHALGTAREIVTRLLRRFEQEGWVALGRNEIRIVDARALRAQAGENAEGAVDRV
jgi:CRP/FNR family transcriptional regulator